MATSFIVRSISLTFVLIWSAQPRSVLAQQSAAGEVIPKRPAVEHDAAGQDRWNEVVRKRAVFVGDSVRTGDSGKAAVRFNDDSGCTLSARLTLTVRSQSEVRFAKAADAERVSALCSSNRLPATRLLETFAGSVEIRGTEFVIDIFQDRMVLTVIEGSARLFNSADEVIVNASEEGTARPGEAPTKRSLLNPEDAVQWALNYPTAFPAADISMDAIPVPLRAGFQDLGTGNALPAVAAFESAVATGNASDWARLGLAAAYQQAGRLADAQRALDGPVPAGLAAEWYGQRAAVALDLGEVTRAREDIQQAVTVDSGSLRALTLLATLELTQNHKEAAKTAVDRAIAAHRESVAANKAASEVAQSFFELDRALTYIDRAIAHDSRHVPSLVNRARLRFGMGDVAAAKEDAARAVAIAPNDPLVLSLLGFIELADADLRSAEQHFTEASAADSRFGEPYVGLGLVLFQQGRTDEGIVQFRNAALVEPRVSLYQSYLGKAYYQAERFSDGLRALETAKRLDPRDPTPWLYQSYFLRDQNRHVEALRALYEALSRNGNRAVYRSRFLLDRDVATGSVSLAEVYRQLGFDAFGAAEAIDSVDTDITNASAHLFLAGNFLARGDRLQAGSSERLQYFLYAPVNRNMFFTAAPTTGFNEYTTLIDSPWQQLSFEGGAGDAATASGVSRSGNRRFAHFGAIEYDAEKGARPEARDTRWIGILQGKVGLGSTTDVFFEVNASDSDQGDQEEQAITVNGSRADPFSHFRLTSDLDEQYSLSSRTIAGTVGFKHEWRLGTALTGAVQIQDLDPASNQPQVIPLPSGGDLRLRTRLEVPEHSVNVQLQQVLRLGRQQFTIGAEMHRNDKSLTNRLFLNEPDFDELAVNTVEGQDRDTSGWFRADVRPWDRMHVTLGARYSDVRWFETSNNQTYELARWQPMVGTSVRLTPGWIVRGAAFRQVNSNLLGSRLSPTTIEGFVLDRNDYPATVRDEFNASVERRRWNAFHSVHGFFQKVDSEVADAFDFAEPSRRAGVEYQLNQVLASRWTFFASDQFARTEPKREGLVQDPFARLLRFVVGYGVEKDQYVQWDNRLRIGVGFIHESGWRVRLEHTNLIQRFSDTKITDLEDTVHNATDIGVAYEFAGKRGTVGVEGKNLFDEEFTPFIEPFFFGFPRVNRQVVVSFRWRL